MNKSKFQILLGMMVVSACGYAETGTLRATQKSIISENTEFAQTMIDQKCHKLQKKIRRLQEKLDSIDSTYSDEDSEWIEEKKEKILKDIQKYENLLNGLQRVNDTVTAIPK